MYSEGVLLPVISKGCTHHIYIYRERERERMSEKLV